MLIDDKAHCTIEYDPKLKCVVQTWKGFSGSQNFRASLLKTLEVFRTQEATSIISKWCWLQPSLLVPFSATLGNPKSLPMPKSGSNIIKSKPPIYSPPLDISDLYVPISIQK